MTEDLSDILNAVAKTLKGITDAQADDGKVSTFEVVGLAASLTPSFMKAIKGIRNVPLELKYLSKAEADALYFNFLHELEWQASEDTKQKFFLVYDTAVTIITNLLQWKRVGAAPPKAEIDPE